MPKLLKKRQSPSTKNLEDQSFINQTNGEESNWNIDPSADQSLLISRYPKLRDMVD
jgi:hypothetical protein